MAVFGASDLALLSVGEFSWTSLAADLDSITSEVYAYTGSEIGSPFSSLCFHNSALSGFHAWGNINQVARHW
jgi:hypothetical protein